MGICELAREIRSIERLWNCLELDDVTSHSLFSEWNVYKRNCTII